MLKTHLHCLNRAFSRNFQSKSVTRSFFTPTQPVTARLKLNVKVASRSTENRTSKPRDDNTSTQRLRKGPADALFRALRRSILSSKDQQRISSRVQKCLDQFIPRVVHPHRTYEDVVRFLMEHSCLPAAIAVYERMVAEGLIVSPSLESQVLAVAISLTDGASRKLFFSALREVIRKKAFTSDDLLNVLGKMSDLDLPSESLLEIMSVFEMSHKSLGTFEPDITFFKKLVYSGVRDGDGQSALDALAALTRSGVDKNLIPDVYASFFAAIRKSVRPSRAAITAAIEQMEKHGIKATLSVWSALIAYEVRTNSLHRPFAIYASLKDQPNFLADDYIFGSLFNALNRFFNPKRRRIRHGRRLPDNIPTPRALYRDMIEAFAHDPQAPSFQLTTSLLNSVLRSFIFKRDYAGACAVIRSYSLHRVPVNAKTYFIVFRHLMNRITYGIRAFRKKGSVKWADCFLDLPYPIHDPRPLSELPLSNALAGHILDLSRRRGFRSNWPLYLTPQPHDISEPVQYQVPTVQAMLGQEDVPADQSFDIIPLVRLVKKALLAEMELEQKSGKGRPTSPVLSKAIVDAREEMIPHRLSGRLKKIRELEHES